MVMLSHVAETGASARRPHASRSAAASVPGDAPDAHGTGYLVEFRLEAGLPVWRYDVEGVTIEKRLFLPHMQNTVIVMYELLSGADRVELELRPSVNFRVQEAPVSEPLGWPYEIRMVDQHAEICLPAQSRAAASPEAVGRGGDADAGKPAPRERAVSGGGEPRLPRPRRFVESRLLPRRARVGPARRARRVNRIDSRR